MGKIPWIPLKTMEHAAGAKFHGFHGEISMLSMLSWNRKIVKIFPMKAWNLKPWKTMESMVSMGIYKNESMESMVFSGILLLIISRKHGKHGRKAWEESIEKHGIYANEFTSHWFPGSSWLSLPLLTPW